MLKGTGRATFLSKLDAYVMITLYMLPVQLADQLENTLHVSRRTQTSSSTTKASRLRRRDTPLLETRQRAKV
jgi:hypothetical protein